jgi:hypothetical protein
MQTMRQVVNVFNQIRDLAARERQQPIDVFAWFEKRLWHLTESKREQT